MIKLVNKKYTYTNNTAWWMSTSFFLFHSSHICFCLKEECFVLKAQYTFPRHVGKTWDVSVAFIIFTVISQPWPYIHPIFWLSFSHTHTHILYLCVIGWDSWWHVRGRVIKPPAPALSDTDTISVQTERYYTDTKPPTSLPIWLQPTAMCKGLASLPICCLERYVKLQTVWEFK